MKKTPNELLYAALDLKEDLKAVKSAIAKGADVNALDKTGRSVFNYANTVKTVKYLVACGADINRTKDSSGRTSIFNYLSNSDIEILKYLISCGAQVDVKDNKGQTALMIAAEHLAIDVMKLLLKNGANICQKDKYGKTAMDHAYESNPRPYNDWDEMWKCSHEELECDRQLDKVIDFIKKEKERAKKNKTKRNFTDKIK